MRVRTIHTCPEIDFDLPGTAHYEVAFHHDGTWGNVLRFLVPLVITDDQLDEGLDVIEAQLFELAG